MSDEGSDPASRAPAPDSEGATPDSREDGDADRRSDSTPAAGPGSERGEGRTGGEDRGEDGDRDGDGGALAGEHLGERRRLDGKVRVQWVVGTTLGSVVGGAVVAAALAVFGGAVGAGRPGPLSAVVDSPVLAGVLVFALLFGYGAVRALLLYRSWRYEVREDSLYLERGVITHTRTVVPYVRIQHVDASRGPVERALGLATAVVYTAGSRGADVSIPGLTTDRADDLQERLKGLAIAAEGEDAV
jgi:membrane protein YdbS with pleckstrin-like domain